MINMKNGSAHDPQEIIQCLSNLLKGRELAKLKTASGSGEFILTVLLPVGCVLDHAPFLGTAFTHAWT